MSLLSDFEFLDLKNEQENTLDGLCNIEQFVEQGTDVNGGPLPPHWETLTPDVPSAFIPPTSGQGEIWNATRMVVLNDYSVMVPNDIYVTVKNRVTNIRDRFGNEVISGNPPYDIKDIIPGTFGKILILESIK